MKLIIKMFQKGTFRFFSFLSVADRFFFFSTNFMNQFPSPYYYLVMSQVDFFENQVIEEILRERATFYHFQKKIRDFWLVLQPSFLQDSQLQEKMTRTWFYNSQIKRPENSEQKGLYFVSLVSLDKNFIQWIALRTGHFEDLGSVEHTTDNSDSITTQSLTTHQSLTTQSFTSNGMIGSFDKNPFSCLCCPFTSQAKKIHPKILSHKYQRAMRFFHEV